MEEQEQQQRSSSSLASIEEDGATVNDRKRRCGSSRRSNNYTYNNTATATVRVPSLTTTAAAAAATQELVEWNAERLLQDPRQFVVATTSTTTLQCTPSSHTSTRNRCGAGSSGRSSRSSSSSAASTTTPRQLLPNSRRRRRRRVVLQQQYDGTDKKKVAPIRGPENNNPLLWLEQQGSEHHHTFVDVDDDDDEFTAAEWAQMDSLVLAATRTTTTVASPVPFATTTAQQKSRNDTRAPTPAARITGGSCSSTSIPQSMLNNNGATATTCTPHPPNNKDDDTTFDFMDDIDDDAWEQAIAAATTSSSSLSSSSSSSALSQQQPPPIQPARGRPFSFSRYRVMGVERNTTAMTMTVHVAHWTDDHTRADQRERQELHHPPRVTEDDDKAATVPHYHHMDGTITLHDHWVYTELQPGDAMHVCSITGTTPTHVLPLSIHSSSSSVQQQKKNDLVLIAHPDLLLPPTVISEGVVCKRRAVLKTRLGSTGLTTPAALHGTLRHGLMEHAMRTQDFSTRHLQQHVQTLVREHAEDVLSCQASSMETEREIAKVIPQLQRFHRDVASGKASPLEDSVGRQQQRAIAVQSQDAIVEESVVCPTLGLKGNIDLLVNVTSGDDAKTLRRMAIELKTSHRQTTQPEHCAQLFLYTLMLQTTTTTAAAAGSTCSDGGMLLYLNQNDLRAVHVDATARSEIEQLLCLRNEVAVAQARSLCVQQNQRPPPQARAAAALAYDAGHRPQQQQQRPLQTSALQQACAKETAPAAATATTAELPPLLASESQCKRCYSNRECMLYAAASDDRKGCGAATSTSSSLLASFTGHLSAKELDYFRHWERLLDLEADAENSSIAKAWLLGSHDSTAAIGSLLYDTTFSGTASLETTTNNDRKLVHVRFNFHGGERHTATTLTPGQRIVVSSDSTTLDMAAWSSAASSRRSARMHLARGNVVDTSADGIVIRVGRDDRHRIERFLAQPHAQTTLFRLDHDKGAAGTGTLRQNLIQLLTADKKANREPGTQAEEWQHLPRLRKLIIEMEPPRFLTDVQLRGECMSSQLSEDFRCLNPDQQQAVMQVMQAKDYALIQGLPGTGKTSTITFLVRLLVSQGKRVLVTSYTHSAVDNMLLKFIKQGLHDDGSGLSKVVRIDRYGNCHPQAREILAQNLAMQLETSLGNGIVGATQPAAESLRRVVSAARVVGVSALTIPKSSLLVGQEFDVVVVDEAGQISQPAILGALMAASTFVLVGDHMQLPPLAVSELSMEEGFCCSMLRRLADQHPGAVTQLSLQYRMHQDICQLSNDIVYGGALKCADQTVACRTLLLPGFPENVVQRPNRADTWLRQALDPRHAVAFLDTDGNESSPFRSLERKQSRKNDGRSGMVNDAEANLVCWLLQSLVACGCSLSSIGVIVPFKSQLRLIESKDQVGLWKSGGLELSTIDSFQGRDKQVIVLSLVRSNEKGRVGRLLQDFRRINVAVTRAKCKLIVIGSASTLHKGSPVTRKIINRVKSLDRIFPVPVDNLN